MDSPIWVDAFLDLSFDTVASNSWSNFLAEPVSWPSPSTQATWYVQHYNVCCKVRSSWWQHLLSFQFNFGKFHFGTEPGVCSCRRDILRGVRPRLQCRGHAQTLDFYQRYQSALPWMIVWVGLLNANIPGQSAHFMLLFRLHMFPKDVPQTWKLYTVLGLA